MTNITKPQPITILKHNYTSLFMVAFLLIVGLILHNFGREGWSFALIFTALVIPFMTFSYVKMYDDYFVTHYYLIPFFTQKINYIDIAGYEIDNVAIILTTKKNKTKVITRLKNEHILLQKILEHISGEPSKIIKS